MLILALSVCLAQEPATCKVVQLPFFAEHIPASECARYGVPEAKRWLEKNPQWKRSDGRPASPPMRRNRTPETFQDPGCAAHPS
ncbi:hypothetical protein [Breoghania sp.]|uniref:hypothetical protein n=1 Tax=Breoghania sp. TaxID=2065378 RepID=UPI0026116250|nr:hypothetical protein [Breoghania sp.]